MYKHLGNPDFHHTHEFISIEIIIIKEKRLYNLQYDLCWPNGLTNLVKILNILVPPDG